ncbi:Uncharacterised protein [Streptococcus mutans]|nr:Uncharacterised protein [Streptococcus mutans]
MKEKEGENDFYGYHVCLSQLLFGGAVCLPNLCLPSTKK